MSSGSTTQSGDAALFLRKATGLVRSWSVFDAFIYAFFSINLVTLGLYSISQMYFFEGGMLYGLLLFGGLILAEVVVYAALIAVMPRAGGDYVWQSRILGGGVGFALAVTGWWFILWLWTPLYGDMLRKLILVPLLAILGQRDTALWINSDSTAFFAASLLTLAFVTIIIIVGMKRYATFQKWSFWIGNAGLLMVIAVLFSGDHESFKAAFASQSAAMFGTDAATIYAATVAAGTEAGAVNPLMGGNLNSISLLLPWIAFFLLYPNWGATLYGEVKGADDFKRNFNGMAAAVAVTVGLLVLFFFAIDRSITWQFYMQANGAYWNYTWGYTDVAPAFPIWPYPALLAGFMTGNPAIQILIIVAMSMWFFGWAGTMFLSSTRVIFAAAFDRLLPEAVAQVDEKTRTPIWALVLMLVPGAIVSYLYCYNIVGFQSLTLAATLVIGITFFGTAVAATILPYTKKDLYQASPIAKYQVLGIPLITVAGAITTLFLGFLLYQWMIDPNALYGIGLSNTTSVYFMLALYGVAIAIYVGMRIYRARKGVNLDVLYREIPVE